MHNYSLNDDSKLRVLFLIALLSLFIVGFAKDLLITIFEAPVYVSVPSAFTVYGFFHMLFNNCVWKWALLYKVGLVKTPIVEGKWEGELRSSVDDYSKPFKVTLHIHQTWDKISICLDGDNTYSESKMANFRIVNPLFCEFGWSFVSQTKPEFSKKDYICYGTASVRLTFDKGNQVKNILEGSYYTDKGTHTFGSIKLIKVVNA
ncbi:hypothetical protein [Methylophilus sp. Q8]|uniref:Cap15 family cyclic dinucleotide receptor domain-containing protein n=1 Tax=Methylophilus sp. Q8 TaxID=1506586 RepID=UPI00064586EF|nr:hypothetical protein [Methylophilus sp. Q8]